GAGHQVGRQELGARTRTERLRRRDRRSGLRRMMNIHASPTLTPAESALVEAFSERVSELPGDAAVTVMRDDAVEMLKGGLPTRRIEAWHYTDLRRLLTTVPAFEPSAQPDALRPLIDGSTVL